jgi:UDP-N-acetylglucosamine transferase subunit ALG13
VKRPDDLPFIFVTVGTDHHPFDRLIEWVDGWLAVPRSIGVRCFMQSGASRRPLLAPSKRYVSPGDVRAASGRATAVVCQGGPGSIMTCRSQGVLPIVIPRRRRFGEAVDDHQVAFSRRMAAQQEVFLAEARNDLWALLDRALNDPSTFRALRHDWRLGNVTQRFADLVDNLLEPGAASRSGQPGLTP